MIPLQEFIRSTYGTHSARSFHGWEGAALCAAAAKKDERSERVDWTVEMVENYNLYGVVGEWCFGQVSGLEPDYDKFGDDGVDFVLPSGKTVDVKGTKWRDQPNLLPPRLLRADIYAVVNVHLVDRVAQYIGWATKQQILDLPEEPIKGSLVRRVLVADLRRGVPT